MYTKLSVRPQMNISAQLVIASRLLEAPGSELEQYINQEMTNNPALERANEDSFVKRKSSFDFSAGQDSLKSKTSLSRQPHSTLSFEEMLENIPQRPSPVEKLMKQVALSLNKADYDIAIHLLYRLDSRGFLTASPDQLARELGVSEEPIQRVIRVLHQIDPPGIGARDVQECLLIQCDRLEIEGIDCRQVRRILTSAWSEFLKQQWDQVVRKTQGTRKSIKDAREFMRQNLHPYPLASLETPPGETDRLHDPDLIVLRDPHAFPPIFSLEIPGEEEFELRISSTFQRLMESETYGEHGLSTRDRNWIKTHSDRARMVIGALRQRWRTLRRIGEHLIEHQKAYLEHGPLHLKCMTRMDLARELHMHESTISRAVSEKIIQLPNKHLMLLDEFFDPSLAAKEAVRILLQDNARSLCDRKIAEILQTRGMDISRRTITKYRHQLNTNIGRRHTLA